MRKSLLGCVAVIAVLLSSASAFAQPATEETKIFQELSARIPKDRWATIDELYKKWQEVQAKKSNAVILDIRTAEEFDYGHLLGANNIDSGHPYQVPKSWPDANTEIWVFCRTKHRATYFASFLMRYGYKNVRVVDGGIAGWAEKGYPLYNAHLGEIKVTKYNKELKEEYKVRQR